MTFKGKPKVGMVWTFAETIGVKVFSVSVYLILAKLLGPQPFGVVALTSTFILLSTLLIEQGFLEALIQRKELNKELLSSAFWGLMALGFIFFLVMFFSAPLIAKVFSEAQIEDILKVLSVNFLINSSSLVHLALLERALNFKVVAVARIIGIIAGGITSIVLAFSGFGAWSLVIQQLIFALIQSVVFWVSSGWRPTFGFSWAEYKDLSVFGSKILLLRIIGRGNQYFYDLLIGYFLGTVALGYYSFAYKIYNTVSDVINLSFSRVLLPVFSALQDRQEQLREQYYKVSTKLVYLVAMVLSFMVVLLPTTISFFYGQKWSSSIPLIQVFLVAGFGVSIYWMFDTLLISTNQLKKSLQLTILNVVVGLVLLVAFRNLHLGAVSWSVAGKTVVGLAVILFMLRNFLQDRYVPFLLHLGGALLISVLTFLLVTFASGYVAGEVSPLLLMAFEGVAFAVFGVLAFLVVKPKMVFDVYNYIKVSFQ